MSIVAVASFLSVSIMLVATAAILERIYAYRQAKLGRLICRYNSREVAQRVFLREIWQGQTERQLLDSRGEPASRIPLPAAAGREAWLYNVRRFSRDCLRVILEDGIVMDWGAAKIDSIAAGELGDDAMIDWEKTFEDSFRVKTDLRKNDVSVAVIDGAAEMPTAK
jgi:hypothetical protein